MGKRKKNKKKFRACGIHSLWGDTSILSCLTEQAEWGGAMGGDSMRLWEEGETFLGVAIQ